MDIERGGWCSSWTSLEKGRGSTVNIRYGSQQGPSDETSNSGKGEVES